MKNTQILGIIISLIGLIAAVSTPSAFANFPYNLTAPVIGGLALFFIGLYLILKDL